jgi:hypothetical protein
MDYKEFVNYSKTFENMTLSDIIKLHKNYIKVLSAIKRYYSKNEIAEVKLSEISEVQYANIIKNVIF